MNDLDVSIFMHILVQMKPERVSSHHPLFLFFLTCLFLSRRLIIIIIIITLSRPVYTTILLVIILTKLPAGTPSSTPSPSRIIKPLLFTTKDTKIDLWFLRDNLFAGPRIAFHRNTSESLGGRKKHIIDQTIRHRFLAAQIKIPHHIVMNLGDGLSRNLGEFLLDPVVVLLHVLDLQPDVGRLTLKRFLDSDALQQKPCVWHARPLTPRTRSAQHGTHTGGQSQVQGGYFAFVP
mmetsp:Transcript_47982/g.71090  ORF Transcript_47982/g.71090 Transcript_47982/m.71090 type:complete len:234 (-) Transcript_47982:473-1174(-)